MDTIRISLLHSKYPISYNKKYISHFCYLSVKSLHKFEENICFENIYFSSKFVKLCPESLKKHTDKISLRSDETQIFYWSFKYMSNYHLKSRTVFLHNIWAASWQNQQSECAPSEDSDQPEHPPSLIRIFAVCTKEAWTLSYSLSAQRRLWWDWADAQADLSLRWAHSRFVGFVTRRLVLCTCK